MNQNVTTIICFSIVELMIFPISLKELVFEEVTKAQEKNEQVRLDFEKEMIHRKKELEQEFTLSVRDFEKEMIHRRKELEQEFALSVRDFNEEIRLQRQELEKEKRINAVNHSNAIKDIKKKENELQLLLDSKTPFQDVAKMRRDVIMAIFNTSIKHLLTKRNPARIAAEEIKAMRRISSQILFKSKEIEYKYEYILAAFPEIGEYVNNDEDLVNVGKHLSYVDLDDMRDRRKDYMSKEEYNRLSETQRSQLALDRYVQNLKKDKWQIGRDYEMSCAFQLRSRGYHVEMHGIKYQKSDLGRDLIATRNIGGLFGKEVLIVQCKNWSHNRTIHENVVMQLFGTAVEYQITFGSHDHQEIEPVLMIPPYSVISDVALQFAKKLKVRIEQVENIDFPRIKCNINNGNKIYHLPFDQQYDRTEIKLQGECYAYTVAEAEAKGFRRAMRHNFAN